MGRYASHEYSYLTAEGVALAAYKIIADISIFTMVTL